MIKVIKFIGRLILSMILLAGLIVFAIFRIVFIGEREAGNG